MDFFENLALDLIANVETANVDGMTPTLGFLLIQQRITERLVVLADTAGNIDDVEAGITEPTGAGVTN